MPPRSQTRPPHLPYVVSAFGACEKIRRLNAELSEHAEKSPKHFFSAASAASALNVICSQTEGGHYVRFCTASSAQRTRAEAPRQACRFSLAVGLGAAFPDQKQTQDCHTGEPGRNRAGCQPWGPVAELDCVDPWLEPQSLQRDVGPVESCRTAVDGGTPSWMPDFADDQKASVCILCCDGKRTCHRHRYFDVVAGIGDRGPCGRRCVDDRYLPQVDIFHGTIDLLLVGRCHDV